MTRERSMAASAFGGGRGAAVGGAGARRRRWAGAVVVARGSWEAATRIFRRRPELQIKPLQSADTAARSASAMLARRASCKYSKFYAA